MADEEALRSFEAGTLLFPIRENRPSFAHIHMEMAKLLAQRSTCVRLQVGCVIASEDHRKILAMGYNGNATGLPNKCDSNVPGNCQCIHAEQNAVINCDSPRHWPKIVYCTNLPCVMCAKFMINMGGVQKVYFDHDYRIRDGLDILDAGGIEWQPM